MVNSRTRGPFDLSLVLGAPGGGLALGLCIGVGGGQARPQGSAGH